MDEDRKDLKFVLGNFAFMLFEGGLVHAGNSAKSSDCLHEGGGRVGRAARRSVSLLVLFPVLVFLDGVSSVAKR